MDKYRVKPGKKIKLKDWDPDDKSEFDVEKEIGEEEVLRLNDELEHLQEFLYAEGKNKILIVLQAMDAGGKDGTIRHVFDGVNPQGVKVASFKQPTKKELSHDYLWRIHQHTPASGEIVIFNRSHYEDVLVVRVNNYVKKKIWKKRYEHINNFEKMLTDEGTTIIKFFLHISKEEQKLRFMERLDNKEKNWKFSTSDLESRKRWNEYTDAFEDMLNKTSTDYAPWYIVPSNRKWYRNIVISRVIINALENLNMKYPEPEKDLSKIVVE
ncbi:MAG: polyphosphate kinase 2 family protein [Candidatus Dadabacteria bacterium]|nr:polyphosphate kinase 2 family protein [Candidatus Dadabacteria bacterium]NIQ14527.1 polyphosphate kinase 2 family protein [Candidatus Dadabacteria bacterium]